MASSQVPHPLREDLPTQGTLWNFVRYNVVGGGDSALYGVESSTYYLRNAFTNLNLVLPLALLAPLSALFLMMQRRGKLQNKQVEGII